MLAFFLSFFNVGRNSSLHIPCWLYFYLGSFSYTSHADFIFYCEEFLLHIPYCLCFYLGSFSYTSHACIIFLWGVSLTHPTLASFHSFLAFFFFLSVWGISLTHPVQAFFFFFFFFFFTGLFRHTMLTSFLFFLSWGVSITHPVLAFTCGEFLLYIPCWLYIYLVSFSCTSRSGFIFIWGVSLTHPKLALIFCGEFLTPPMLALKKI